MDPVTHGITGALLGKAYFSDRYGKAATFAAVLGAVFPDIDVTADFLTRDPMAIVKYHRALTHSFVALPVFALLLAFLTRAFLPWARQRFKRWREVESPPLGILTLIYAIGIASHIILDGMTSFGTRMWFPISSTRVAWDLLFIIDFSFTAVVLLPQVISWILAAGSRSRAAGADSSVDRAQTRRRAMRMCVIFGASTFAIWLLTRAAGYPFQLRTAALLSALLAVMFFGPAIAGWGYRIRRARWCQAGVVGMIAYLLACGFAHHSAILYAERFAGQSQTVVDRLAALPIPPSAFDWGDAIRTPDGLFEARFDLREKNPPVFWRVPDSPPDSYTARAFQLPSVQLYWQFARFPSIHSYKQNGMHLVELGENRFSDGRRRSPQPFTYEVVYDDSGALVAEGWHTDGVLGQRMRRMIPQQSLPGAPPKANP